MCYVFFDEIFECFCFRYNEVACLFPYRQSFEEYFYVSVTERFCPTGRIRTQPSSHTAAVEDEKLVFFLRQELVLELVEGRLGENYCIRDMPLVEPRLRP